MDGCNGFGKRVCCISNESRFSDALQQNNVFVRDSHDADGRMLACNIEWASAAMMSTSPWLDCLARRRKRLSVRTDR